MGEISMDKQPISQEQLKAWREEQLYIASHVTIPEEPEEFKNLMEENDSSSCPFSTFKINQDHLSYLYGGVDVSFPKNETEQCVAVYVVMRGMDIVYCDHEFFTMTVPYVSSYLAFREIDPYVSTIP